MAYLQLSSKNPDFSFILKKNPASGMLIKASRKGRLFAWYTNPEIFNIYFRDSDMEVSYSDEDFEYMDATRYNSPIFVINAFHEFLNHMKRADEKDIPGYENILMINQIKCKHRYLDDFQSHFPDYKFEFEEVATRNYKVWIKTNNTIRELINLGQIFAIFNALMNRDYYLYVTDSDLDKYMGCVGVIDAPYYMKHLFKCYFLKTEKNFKKYKILLETSKREKLELEFGNNQEQRTNTIRKFLDFKSPIVDIGCGEGHYVREFAPKLNGLEYHAIDINPKRIEIVKRLCDRKQIENVATWTSIDEFACPDNSVILMTEVIEHMSKDEAKALINKILDWPFRSLIITTPNKEFNSNYKLLEEDVRDDDHKIEFAKEEFRILIEELINNKSANFFEIGDKVNNLQPTLAVIVSKKRNNEIVRSL